MYSLGDLNKTFDGLLCVFWYSIFLDFQIYASLMVAKREFTPAILFCLHHALFTP